MIDYRLDDEIRSVPEIVAERVRESILEGQLKPGERLLEQKWAARFSVGQPTIREAFRLLEVQGFVRKSRQRGTYVTELSRDECRKLLEVRMALEAVAVQRAAACATPESLARVTDALHELENAARELDRGRFHQADMAFHERVCEMAGNEHLSRMLEQVAFRLFAFIKMRPAIETEYNAAVEQHRRICEGLHSGDPAAALEAFTESTLKFWKEQFDIETEDLVLR